MFLRLQVAKAEVKKNRSNLRYIYNAEGYVANPEEFRYPTSSLGFGGSLCSSLRVDSFNLLSYIRLLIPPQCNIEKHHRFSNSPPKLYV